jgi:hypothetical protein
MALKEVCIAAIDYPSGRTLAGDIVYIREPKGGVARKTGEHAIILLIDDADIPAGSIDKNDPMRLGVALEDLVGLHPEVNFDLARASNPKEFYQPFIGATRGDGRTRATRAVRPRIESRLARAVRRQERRNGQ